MLIVITFDQWPFVSKPVRERYEGHILVESNRAQSHLLVCRDPQPLPLPQLPPQRDHHQNAHAKSQYIVCLGDQVLVYPLPTYQAHCLQWHH